MSQNTPERKKRFIEAYKKNGFKVGLSCDYAGVTRTTVRRWVKADNDFAEEYENAEEDVLDAVESAVLKRALGYVYTEKKTSIKKDADGNITEKTITRTQRHIIPDINAAKTILEARARHRGYAMKSDESNADQYSDDE